MKILMVSPECYPFAKAGGLGDVVWSLSLSLSEQGHDVKIVLPRYYNINKGALADKNTPVGVPTGAGEVWCGIYSKKINNSLEVLFLDNETLYGREGIYGENSASSYVDNFLRFTVLSRGALQTCLALKWYPDIVHCHDWATTLALLFLKRIDIYSNIFLKNTAGVFTIHNLGYQGIFPHSDFYKTYLPWDTLFNSGADWFSNINLMQLGIAQADFITTVSPTYASEIQRKEYGEGLDGIIRYNSYKVSGILNGCDYNVWNPKTDKLIKENYDEKSLDKKEENKKELARLFGLDYNPYKPIIGIVSRLTSQKGFGELCGPLHGSLFSICETLGVQVAIIGTGEKWIVDELNSLANKTKNLAVKITYNESLSHMLMAGSDFLLVPSLYEPCGLTQMYALKYGTVPIVSELGGLYDTVYNYNYHTKSGTGFFIHHPINPNNIFHSVNNATRLWWDDRQSYLNMQISGMKNDFNWKDSSKKYSEIYSRAIENKLSR